jgi:hypothetical protein
VPPDTTDQSVQPDTSGEAATGDVSAEDLTDLPALMLDAEDNEDANQERQDAAGECAGMLHEAELLTGRTACPAQNKVRNPKTPRVDGVFGVIGGVLVV